MLKTAFNSSMYKKIQQEKHVLSETHTSVPGRVFVDGTKATEVSDGRRLEGVVSEAQTKCPYD